MRYLCSLSVTLVIVSLWYRNNITMCVAFDANISSDLIENGKCMYYMCVCVLVLLLQIT